MSDDSNESMSLMRRVQALQHFAAVLRREHELFELNWCEESKLCSILQQCSEENMNMKLGHEHSPLWWETPCTFARILQLLCNRRTNELLSRSIQAFTASQALPGAEASQHISPCWAFFSFFFFCQNFFFLTTPRTPREINPTDSTDHDLTFRKRGAFKDGIFTCEGCNVTFDNPVLLL